MSGQVLPIALEQPRALAAPHKLALARMAHAAAPDSVEARERLAALLVRADLFDEAATVLESAAALRFGGAMHLAEALLALDTDSATERARAAAEQAVALADDDVARSLALATRARCERRLELATTAATLREALRLDPHNIDACKRLAAHHLEREEPGAVLSLVDDLMARGVTHTRLLMARTLAFAQQGDIAAARDTVGLDAFLYRGMLRSPVGWASIAAFNAALAEQVAGHPAIRFERYGTASEQSWRIDEPLSREAPLVEVALDAIREAAATYVATLGGDHPWLRMMPARAVLRSWCILAESGGYETWHAHQSGWLSGVYYVRVPDAVREGGGEGGCIAWGLPDDLVGAASAAAFGTPLVRPEPGLLLLFPSHAYHRTFAHGADERRIVLAFDFVPG